MSHTFPPCAVRARVVKSPNAANAKNISPLLQPTKRWEEHKVGTREASAVALLLSLSQRSRERRSSPAELSWVMGSVCNWSGPDRSHGPKIRTGPKFGTGPRTGPSELPKVQYIFSVLKINIANLAAFVVKDMYSKFSNYR